MNKDQQKLIEFIKNNPECASSLRKALDEKKELKVWENYTHGYYMAGAGDIYELGFWARSERYEMGLTDPTREFVEQTRDFTKVIAKLRRQTKGFVPDWDNLYEQKCCIYFDHGGNIITTTIYNNSNLGLVYFRTVEDAQAAADSLTPEEIETFKKGWPVYPMVEGE